MKKYGSVDKQIWSQINPKPIIAELPHFYVSHGVNCPLFRLLIPYGNVHVTCWVARGYKLSIVFKLIAMVSVLLSFFGLFMGTYK